MNDYNGNELEIGDFVRHIGDNSVSKVSFIGKSIHTVALPALGRLLSKVDICPACMVIKMSDVDVAQYVLEYGDPE